MMKVPGTGHVRNLFLAIFSSLRESVVKGVGGFISLATSDIVVIGSDPSIFYDDLYGLFVGGIFPDLVVSTSSYHRRIR